MPHLITLTGPSGSGKSTVVKYLVTNADIGFNPELVPKYATREPRKDDGNEIICVKVIPDECDLIYEQYEVRYGIELKGIFDRMAKGSSPIIILNDVRTVEDVRAALKGLVRSVFVFREGPTFERYRQLANSRGVQNEEDTERRFRKAQAIYRIYIENIHLFDHVIVNGGSREDLKMQVRRITNGLKQNMNWPLHESKKVI